MENKSYAQSLSQFTPVPLFQTRVYTHNSRRPMLFREQTRIVFDVFVNLHTGEDRSRARRGRRRVRKRRKENKKGGVALRLLTLIYGCRGREGEGMKSFNGSHPTAPRTNPLLPLLYLRRPPPLPHPRLSFAISVLAILMSTDECYPYEGHPSSNRILNYPRIYTEALHASMYPDYVRK